jgi:deoxyribodipyrimidine photo-lyase
MIEPERISALSQAPEQPGDYVLYWMQQSQRAAHNPALEVAVAAANRLRLPLLVAFALTDALPGANARHYNFMLQGLAETARQLRERGIAFVMRRGVPPEVILQLAVRAALLVCDQGYLRRQKQWRAHVAAHAGRRVLAVEGDVVVPATLASPKREIGARTLRSKLQPLRERFVVALRRQPLQVSAERLRVQGDADAEEGAQLLARLRINRAVAPVDQFFRGGHSQARARLRAFITQRLPRYLTARVELGTPHVSTLSPYLHFGQISPVEIALAVREAQAPAADRATFLEELIVRRELAVNFVNTTSDYDKYQSLPDWARHSLALHARDPRAHCYTYEELAAARTHDPYWNAAMQEMLTTGFMHNHMRMYWGKKVLEWSVSPEVGYAQLLRLNNTYFLDGRDASSFANVGWVFGLHDRPWPERPVFGNVRYMNAAGLRRKTDIEAYVKRVNALAG